MGKDRFSFFFNLVKRTLILECHFFSPQIVRQETRVLLADLEATPLTGTLLQVSATIFTNTEESENPLSTQDIGTWGIHLDGPFSLEIMILMQKKFTNPNMITEADLV